MCMTSKTARQRKRLMEILENLKEAGYRVFICKDESFDYGMVSDGENIVYIDSAPYGTGFTIGYGYMPGKDFGSSVGYTEDINLGVLDITKEDIEGCIVFGRNFAVCRGIKRYKSLESYLKTYGGGFLAEI